MKMTWKKNPNDTKNKTRKRPISLNPSLPFQDDDDDTQSGEISQTNGTIMNKKLSVSVQEDDDNSKIKNLALDFEHQGSQLAEEGKYCEALGKWETAITLMPERAILHEQKAQVLLELEESWGALKAATRATELEPGWAEAWITLGRAQLNFGEPDCAIDSFDKALALKPDSVEAKADRQTALHHVKRREQLHSTGLSTAENRFVVGDRGVDSL